MLHSADDNHTSQAPLWLHHNHFLFPEEGGDDLSFVVFEAIRGRLEAVYPLINARMISRVEPEPQSIQSPERLILASFGSIQELLLDEFSRKCRKGKILTYHGIGASRSACSTNAMPGMRTT